MIEAVVKAAERDNVENSGATSQEVDCLCEAVCANRDIVFLPWEWVDDATEVLREHSCILHTVHDRGSFALTSVRTFRKQRWQGCAWRLLVLQLKMPSQIL